MKMSLLGKYLLLALAVSLLATSGQAGVICTETDSGATAGDSANGLQQGGCVNSIVGPNPLLFVAASDGEVYFDPFGATFDTSDGMMLTRSFIPDPTFAASFGTAPSQGLWMQLSNSIPSLIRPIWVLPHLTARGPDDVGVAEPIAKWYAPTMIWYPEEMGTEIILDSDGNVSDIITVDNSGPGGWAAITFQSGVPEPGTLTLLGTALVALCVQRMRRAATAHS